MSHIVDRMDEASYTIDSHDDGVALRAAKGTQAVLTESEVEEVLDLDDDGIVGDFYVITEDQTGQGDLMFYVNVDGEIGRHLVNVRSEDLSEAAGAIAA